MCPDLQGGLYRPTLSAGTLLMRIQARKLEKTLNSRQTLRKSTFVETAWIPQHLRGEEIENWRRSVNPSTVDGAIASSGGMPDRTNSAWQKCKQIFAPETI